MSFRTLVRFLNILVILSEEVFNWYKTAFLQRAFHCCPPLAMPELEVRCVLYSFWSRNDKKWVTTNADAQTNIFLGLLSSEDCSNVTEDESWTILAVLVNQDVLQRIPLSPWSAEAEKVTFLAGEASLLVMSGQDIKWRVELETEKSLVELLDLVQGSSLPRAEVVCLAGWQRDITMGQVREWVSDAKVGELGIDSEEARRVQVNKDLLDLVEKVLRNVLNIDACSNLELNISEDLLDVSRDLLDEEVG